MCYCIYEHIEVLWVCCAPTLHVEELVLGGDLRGPLGHSLAVEDSPELRIGLLQDEALGGVVGHQGLVGWDLLRGDFSVQGHLGPWVGHTTGHHSRDVRAQVHNLKVDGGRDEEVVFVLLDKKRCQTITGTSMQIGCTCISSFVIV